MDPVSGRLAPVGSLARPVHDAAAAVISGKIYVFAGGAGSGTDTVQAFDPATGKGSIVGHLPVALSDLASAQVGSTTFLIGGYDGTRPRSEIYATTNGTTFSVVGHLPQGLRYPAVTEIDGRIVIAGGLASSGPTDGVYVFDPATGATKLIARLPAPVAHAAAFSLAGKVYLVGGRDAADAAVTSAVEFDPATGRVESEPRLRQPVADAAVAAGLHRTLLIGGWGATTLSQVMRPSLRPEVAASGSATGGAPASRGSTDVYAAIDSKHLRTSVANDPPYVYVPNGKPGTVEVIDPATFKIVRTIDLGAGSYPEHVTPSWNMRWLYVDVDGRSELAVIDPRNGKLVRIIHGVDHPYNLYFTVDGSKAIDVAEYYDRLDFIDPHTWKLIKPLAMPCNGPDHLDFSADGSYLMIGCEFDGTVVKVDVKTMKVVGTMNVGGLPVDVKLSPNGKVFFVANQGLGGVSVVDPLTMKVVQVHPDGQGRARHGDQPRHQEGVRDEPSRGDDLGDRLRLAPCGRHLERRREPGHGAGHPQRTPAVGVEPLRDDRRGDLDRDRTRDPSDRGGRRSTRAGVLPATWTVQPGSQRRVSLRMLPGLLYSPPEPVGVPKETRHAPDHRHRSGQRCRGVVEVQGRDGSRDVGGRVGRGQLRRQ